MSSIRMIAAALAAALMVPAAAQSDQEAEKWRKGRAAATQPAPAQQGAGAAGAGTAGPDGGAARGARDRVGSERPRHQAGEIGRVARRITRGEEPRAAARRGAPPRGDGAQPASSPSGAATSTTLGPGPDKARIEGELGQLGTKSGEEFDRDFVTFVTRNDSSFVEALKHARDVTPGKDAVFKKWLDDVENVEEEHLVGRAPAEVAAPGAHPARPLTAGRAPEPRSPRGRAAAPLRRRARAAGTPPGAGGRPRGARAARGCATRCSARRRGRGPPRAPARTRGAPRRRAPGPRARRRG